MTGETTTIMTTSSRISIPYSFSTSFRIIKSTAILINMIGLFCSLYSIYTELEILYALPRDKYRNRVGISRPMNPRKNITRETWINEANMSDIYLQSFASKSIILYSFITGVLSSLGLIAIIGHHIVLIFIYSLLLTGSLILRISSIIRFVHYSDPSDAYVDVFFILMESILILTSFRIGCHLKLASDLEAAANRAVRTRAHAQHISQELKELQNHRQNQHQQKHENEKSTCLETEQSNIV